MFVQWSDEAHALGIPDIDNQHKQLFFITNQLFQEGKKEAAERKLIPLFKQLYAYTRFHFSSEEGMLKKGGYPHLPEHKAIHNKFVFQVKEYLESYREKPLQDLDEPLDFLVNWIISHITGDDKTYKKYFDEKSIVPTLHFAPSQAGSKSVNEEAMALWDQKQLSLDMEDIDNQHKELVYILQQMNDLQKAEPRRRWAYIPSIIEKLFYYSHYHFSYEEQLMSRCNYPGTLDHRYLHQDFIYKVQDFAREYKLNKETLNDEILIFLKDWVVEHVLKEDVKYKKEMEKISR